MFDYIAAMFTKKPVEEQTLESFLRADGFKEIPANPNCKSRVFRNGLELVVIAGENDVSWTWHNQLKLVGTEKLVLNEILANREMKRNMYAK